MKLSKICEIGQRDNEIKDKITYLVSLDDKILQEQELKEISIKLDKKDMEEIKRQVGYFMSLDKENREKEIEIFNNPIISLLNTIKEVSHDNFYHVNPLPDLSYNNHIEEFFLINQENIQISNKKSKIIKYLYYFDENISQFKIDFIIRTIISRSNKKRTFILNNNVSISYTEDDNEITMEGKVNSPFNKFLTIKISKTGEEDVIINDYLKINK